MGMPKFQKRVRKMEPYDGTIFSTRETLAKAILIVDLRHKPTQQDVQMYEYLKYLNIPVLIVATKADKVKRGVRNRHLNEIYNTLNVFQEDAVIPFSSETGEGKDDVWKNILIDLGIEI